MLISVVVGNVVANALNNNSPNDRAMGSWMSSYGSHYLDVSHDVAGVNSATDSKSVRAACVKLQSAVGRAQSDPQCHSVR